MVENARRRDEVTAIPIQPKIPHHFDELRGRYYRFVATVAQTSCSLLTASS